MADLFDYLYWRGDLSTRCLPLNPVDGLILSWFSALPHRELIPATLGEAAEAVREQTEGDFMRLAGVLANSPRFRSMPLIRFEQKFSEAEEMQFAALTLLTEDGRAFVAYRSTDATLVGWKEDFNMSFSDEVPAQREAVRYLNEIAGGINLPLRVGGHSKGGNLAVHASARCEPEAQARIETVYNFDGPGTSRALMQSAGYRRIEPRIETYLPESSIVGILLERAADYRVVKSDNIGPMQHIPSSWQVTPVGFELAAGLDRGSVYADRTIRAWLDGMSRAERQVFVDAMYDIVSATDARTVGELAENWRESGQEMLGALGRMDWSTRAALFRGIGGLLTAAVGQLQFGQE